jgi:hypothetical protein
VESLKMVISSPAVYAMLMNEFLDIGTNGL